MDSQCETIRRWVVESGSAVSLGEDHSRHLASCETCRRLVTAEENLNGLLSRAATFEDPDLAQEIIDVIGRKARWRRRIAVLPPIASLLMVMLGVASLGGLPGASAMAAVTRWTSGGWVVLARSAADFGIALTAAARGLSTMIPWPTAVIAALVCGAGLIGVGLVISRWRQQRRWPARF